MHGNVSTDFSRKLRVNCILLHCSRKSWEKRAWVLVNRALERFWIEHRGPLDRRLESETVILSIITSTVSRNALYLKVDQVVIKDCLLRTGTSH